MNRPSYTLHSIPSGTAGVRETLRAMSIIIKQYKKAPEIRELALLLTANLPQKKWLAEVNQIHVFCRDRIRYVKDIRGVETLQTPVQTLRIKQGDCDDKSMLACALLESIGHPTRIIAVGFTGGGYSHVFPQTKIGDKWITLETTEPWPLGKMCPNISNRMIWNN